MMKPFLLQRFELDETWHKDFISDPDWMAKHRIMESLIPQGVQTILDVGCGNGVQAKLLSSSYKVVGMDASETALRQAAISSVRGLSHRLPFATKSFDLVWSSQMLEHLPNHTLKLTIEEMQRVAREWIILSVPYKENLHFRQCRCHNCHRTFHVYGHLQRFDLTRLRHIMQPFLLQSWAFCGAEAKQYHSVLLFLKQNLGREWFSLPDASPICPYCGHAEQEIWHGNRIARWCDRVNQLYVQSRFAPSITPFWIVTLWRAP